MTPAHSVPAPRATGAIPGAAAAPVVLQVGTATVIAAEPAEILAADGGEALAALDRLDRGWWAGFVSFDLGHAIERITPARADVREIPDLLLARYDARLVVDRGETRVEGHGAARARLEHVLEQAGDPGEPVPLGAASSSLGRAAYRARVRSIIDLLEAGDCYQVNLTRRLEWSRGADPIALFNALGRANPAPHAALLVLPRADGDPVAVVSASPERFLAWHDDGDGRVVETRPIKGTGRDADALRASAKNRAENVMIVDLARNDLGRVCEYGTIEVPELCAVEAHPGLFHLVSTVRGRLRHDVGLGGLIGATFPPASVTGAPKPRVLQAIEDLEPVRRGVYCGAVGWIDADRGTGDLAVAIRTFTIADGHTSLGVGGGIVADSVPADEWRETELKAARLLEAAGAQDVGGSEPHPHA